MRMESKLCAGAVAGPEKAKACAERLLGIVPKLMQTLRARMRAGRAAELSVPQFRTLVFFDHNPGAPLFRAAEHLGLTQPSASKLVDALVLRGLLLRTACEVDRRRVDITLTPEGAELLAVARKSAVSAFTGRLSGLTEMELDVLYAVLGSLQEVLGADEAAG